MPATSLHSVTQKLPYGIQPAAIHAQVSEEKSADDDVGLDRISRLGWIVSTVDVFILTLCSLNSPSLSVSPTTTHFQPEVPAQDQKGKSNDSSLGDREATLSAPCDNYPRWAPQTEYSCRQRAPARCNPCGMYVPGWRPGKSLISQQSDWIWTITKQAGHLGMPPPYITSPQVGRQKC